MGLFDGLMGNASEIKPQEVEQELRPILTEGEAVESVFKVIRDMFVFTNKRLILIDKQGITGKKTDYHSVPYKSISHFSVETAGTFDVDSELKIWISSGVEPTISKEFRKDSNVFAVQATLAKHVLK
ncbi:PH domain-containing protein [Paenibacillus aquistagni]|uniref:PH domain-containing protein n=1 Tax=Paenibacillus aquistagni TaxID=1852522 RepID=A0A1X7ILU0_9BACL|nr:PH domain-containing protein [Paenibacillus aquistagni]SMG15283.1 PH domain-containing protein [Paenibacillus aquistagni]